MTTGGSSTSGSGQVRGRGLDAFFDSNQQPAPPVADIDAELAAMLDQEVRAGAPPLASMSVLPSAKDLGSQETAPMASARGVSAPEAEPPVSSAPPITDGWWAGEAARDAAFATARVTASVAPGDEVIDIPVPVTEAPPVNVPTIPAPRPERPAPTEPSAGPTAPAAPAAETTIPAPPTTGATAPATGTTGLLPAGGGSQTPIRVGAVIIDSTPTGTGTPAPAEEAAVGVGPAGELVPAEQPGTQVVVAPMPGQREVLPPGPGVRPTPQQLPTAQTLAPDLKTVVINRLNTVFETGWQKTLHKQLDDLYKQVTTEFSSPPASADRMLTLLQEARQILIESPENYVAVEARMMQVQVTMSRTTESRLQAGRYGPRILGYEILWLAVLLLGLVFAAPLTEFFTRSGNITGATANDLFPFWSTLMWGGIGGIIGALYALWWHVSDQQDFERQYLMWYLVQPIMGVVLGGIVFLLLTGGFLLLQVKPSDANAGARLVPYLVAVLAGFRQNFIYGQFDRLIVLFAPSNNQTSGGQKQG